MYRFELLPPQKHIGNIFLKKKKITLNEKNMCKGSVSAGFIWGMVQMETNLIWGMT